MKTFLVEKMKGRASEVLNAADSDGIAKIKRSDGRTYTVSPLKSLITAVQKAEKEFKSGKLRPASPAAIMRRISRGKAPRTGSSASIAHS